MSDSETAPNEVETRIDELEERLQSLAIAVSTVVEDYRSRRPPTVWAYDARYPLSAENIYEPEFWDVNIKRWVGPEPTLELFPTLRPGRNYKLTATVVDFISPEAKATFGIRVNGKELTLSLAGRGIYRGVFESGVTPDQHVVLHSDVATSPKDDRGEKDGRILSFSFSSIFIVEAS